MTHSNPAKAAIAGTCALKAETFIHASNRCKFETQLRCNGLPTDDLQANKRKETSAYSCQIQVCVISWSYRANMFVQRI